MVFKGENSGMLEASLPTPPGAAPPVVPEMDHVLTSVSLKNSSSESEHMALSAGVGTELLLLLLRRLRKTLGPTLPSLLMVWADDCLRPLLLRALPMVPAMAERVELTLLDSRLMIVGAADFASCVVDAGLVTELWESELLLVLRDTTPSGSCSGGGKASCLRPRKDSSSGEACWELPMNRGAGSEAEREDADCGHDAADSPLAEGRVMFQGWVEELWPVVGCSELVYGVRLAGESPAECVV